MFYKLLFKDMGEADLGQICSKELECQDGQGRTFNANRVTNED